MADETLAELTERFGSGDKALDPDVEAELRSIMRLHELSVEDMYYKWDAYCIKMDANDMKTSITTLRAFKQDLQDSLERSNRAQVHVKTEKRVGATPRTATKTNNDVYGMLDGLTTPGPGRSVKPSSARRRQLETPSVSRVKAEPMSSPLKQSDQPSSMLPPSSFHDRLNAGENVAILNEKLPAAEPPIAPFSEPRILVTVGSDRKKWGYKTLAMKLSEAAEILDDRIEEFTKLVMEHHKLDELAIGSAARQGTTEIVAVGRIASDTSEGKLNEASLVLETSRSTGNAFRVPLNLKQLRGYQFFPGQIVAFKGINASGKEFAVHQVLEVPLLPSAASSPLDLEKHRERLRGGPDAMDSDSEPLPLNIIFASGPYTTDDNLDFEPLHTLCDRAADTYADALVLAGPFIDAEHPLIASGDFDLPDDVAFEPDTATMTTVFKHLISPALNRLASANPQINILLVPSVRDVIDKHVSWPQAPFAGRKELGLPKKTSIIGNPMTVNLNEAIVGISTQDVLWELRQEELVGGRPSDPELLPRLSKHLIEQRHFFPLYPPSDRSKLPKTGTEAGVPPGAMLDVSYLKLAEIMRTRPDVLILPSALPPFVEIVQNVVVINPGYLSKRRGAGTFAKMALYPPDTSQLEIEGLMAHDVFKRARVEITRI
ncbi:DNA polymerase alpha subunit B N-terminal-domain-containing protein [Cercophora newfieldiana]|uniref:DNA polymerase alpha subunit B n=1 Tax=Cercophora newfieldiana TaxID=92897 RepID=A0AA40CUY5_9PEZI|nr:DNA polymerase alpha subunit B N-terminal-domain-containing protein [Cercophora newfieldiana]